MTGQGLSERRALRVIGMSASTYRYQPAPDRNVALRAQIVALAQRHRRYGSGMIYLKLRQSGMTINHKRVERLYAEEELQVRRGKRKKVPVSDRQPLGRPSAANQVWSMDFVFERTAEGRVIKNLTVVDDATHEAWINLDNPARQNLPRHTVLHDRCVLHKNYVALAQLNGLMSKHLLSGEVPAIQKKGQPDSECHYPSTDENPECYRSRLSYFPLFTLFEGEGMLIT